VNQGPVYSDEQLQAFVDDEIDINDRAEIIEAINKDDALACRVCELMQLKDSVRLAYREPPQPVHTRDRWNASHKAVFSVKAVAAIMLLAVGTLIGVLLQPQINPSTSSIVPAGLAQIAPAGDEYRRVVFHISTADPLRLEQALDDAEELLASYQNSPEKVQLEVVANAEGLALLREDASPYAERIHRLAMLYDNLSFLACSRTIEKLKLKGIDVHLLPDAEIIPAALEKIVDRLHEGWVYIRV
jgi:intracellular sulfur oxidation DsrE/DsrF family protein